MQPSIEGSSTGPELTGSSPLVISIGTPHSHVKFSESHRQMFDLVEAGILNFFLNICPPAVGRNRKRWL
jgi:hypothetical protein